jgi:hypothetical protein
MTTTATKPSDYLHIAVWVRQLGSMRYYIVDQQERAFAAGAPINAIYERSEPGGTRSGVWVTVDECVPHRRDTSTPRWKRCARRCKIAKLYSRIAANTESRKSAGPMLPSGSPLPTACF